MNACYFDMLFAFFVSFLFLTGEVALMDRQGLSVVLMKSPIIPKWLLKLRRCGKR